LNPRLDLLQPYPFEQLRALLAGSAPPASLRPIPLSIGGAFIALLLTGNSFSMPSLIGLLMLMGIVTKNSILLVEYAIVARRDHGMTRFDALVDACNKRARPIMMTTIAWPRACCPDHRHLRRHGLQRADGRRGDRWTGCIHRAVAVRGAGHLHRVR
jgi:hypothetical protein